MSSVQGGLIGCAGAVSFLVRMPLPAALGLDVQILLALMGFGVWAWGVTEAQTVWHSLVACSERFYQALKCNMEPTRSYSQLWLGMLIPIPLLSVFLAPMGPPNTAVFLPSVAFSGTALFIALRIDFLVYTHYKVSSSDLRVCLVLPVLFLWMAWVTWMLLPGFIGTVGPMSCLACAFTSIAFCVLSYRALIRARSPNNL